MLGDTSRSRLLPRRQWSSTRVTSPAMTSAVPQVYALRRNSDSNETALLHDVLHNINFLLFTTLPRGVAVSIRKRRFNEGNNFGMKRMLTIFASIFFVFDVNPGTKMILNSQRRKQRRYWKNLVVLMKNNRSGAFSKWFRTNLEWSGWSEKWKRTWTA